MPPHHAFASRRAALGVGTLAVVGVLASSQLRTLQLPVSASGSPRTTTTSTTTTMSSSSLRTAAPGGGGPAASVKAVNLRDIAEIDPRLRKGVLFRCSQIYTPEVLKELKIKTVVDLRGRAERGTKKKGAGSTEPVGLPTLLQPDQIDALGVPVGGRDGANPAAASPAAAAAPAAGGSPPQEAQPGLDMAVTRVGSRGPGSLASVSMDGASSEGSEGGRASSSNNNNNNGAVRMRAEAGELAAALGEQADWQPPDREAFNVIPGRQFGYAMARMPLRVWRSALGNLVTGKDPRRPFVDAFADEQLLGFTKYYKIILEHSKSNIAAVMRVFAKGSNLPSLVHCAHGKDRTGVIIMLLLMLCDVPHEAIVADYVQSEVELRRYREALGLPDPTGATGAVIPLNDVIIASTQETLRALLAWMDESYPSRPAHNYLLSCGLTEAELDAIRRNLLTQAGAAAGAPAAPAAGSTQA